VLPVTADGGYRGIGQVVRLELVEGDDNKELRSKMGNGLPRAVLRVDGAQWERPLCSRLFEKEVSRR
jgi:hypothetical protein